MSTTKVTLINKRDGKERYTRHLMSDAVEMIRTGKLKSGKLIDEQASNNKKVIPGLSTEASMRHEYQACKADALEACRLDSKENFVAHCL